MIINKTRCVIFIICFLLLIVFYISWSYSKQFSIEKKIDIKETFIAKTEYPPVWDPNDYHLSPDGKRFAYQAAWYKETFIILDGKKEDHYDDIDVGMGLIFSPDSKHFAYIAHKFFLDYLVLDNKQIASSKRIYKMIFSPDSKRYAYISSSGKHWKVTIDGKDEKKYDAIIVGPYFSPDSKHVVYSVRNGEKRFIIMDGTVKSNIYDDIGGIYFSIDSRHTVYKAKDKGKWLIIYDDVAQDAKFDEIGSFIFSQDSTQLAFIAREGEKWLIEINGKKEIVSHEHIDIHSIMFDPSGKRLNFKAKEGSKQYIVVNGDAGKKYDKIGLPLASREAPVFSPDGNHVAYPAQENNKWVMVVDGRESKQYDEIECGPFFSLNSKHVAFVAEEWDKNLIEVDSNNEPWIPEKAIKKFVVVDGKEGKRYDHIGDNCFYTDAPVFSPDSKHFAYAAQEKDKWIVVTDNVEIQQYDWILRGRLTFNLLDTLHYLAKKGNKIYLVEQKIQ